MIAERSRKALAGVHPDLVKVIERADANGLAFVVVCGRRTIEQQRDLVAQGKSRTLKSRHLTGHAVDLVDAGFSWSEAAMKEIAAGIKQAAGEIGVPIEWGGDWQSFVDTPHFQLPVAQYPDGETGSPAPAKPAQPGETGKPLAKSGTIWGSIGAGAAGVLAYLEEGWHAATATVAAMTEVQPLRDGLATAGGNSKAIAFSLTIGCLALVVCRRIKAKQEGKAG